MESILLIDDKRANIVALQGLLENEKRIFYSATNGNEALRLALHHSPDLIILDVQMPCMNGFEVAEILRSNKRTKDIPIIFASAEMTGQNAVLKGLQEGAIDYLPKPLDPEITRAKVSVLLQMRHQQKELVRKNASLEKSQLLINNSADIIGIVDGHSLKIESMNPAFTNILGYKTEQFLDHPLASFLSSEGQHVLAGVSENNPEKISFESIVYCADASSKWLQFNIVVKNSKWFLNARDITQLKYAQNLKHQLATVVKQSHDAIYLVSMTGQINSWNYGAQRLFGYTEKEVLAFDVWHLIPHACHDQMRDIFQRLPDIQQIEQIETKRIAKDKTVLDVLFSASIIRDLNTGENSIAVTEKDITRQKADEEEIKQLNAHLQSNVLQLQETNKELESFSYSVSHDLLSPLRAISGYANILGEDHSNHLGAEGTLLIGKITNNAIRMKTLINDLLEFSKLGKKNIRAGNIAMYELVQGVLTELPIPEQTKITLDPLPHGFGDSNLLRQVWINIISNAIKYSAKKDDPHIIIGSLPHDGQDAYFVQDNGAGFDMLYAEKLFGTFQRLHGNSEFEGTGIGLAIVKRIITRHGGKVWANAKPNEGATFYFTLPSSGTTSSTT